MKAMIFAAGIGTRLRPLTDSIPKALVPVGGTPLLEILVRKLAKAGFSELVINVHHHARQVVRFLEEHQNFGLSIRISDESDLLLDTGGGLKKAAPLLMGQGPFLLHNVDILSAIRPERLMDAHLRTPSALATLAVNMRPTTRQLLVNGDNRLCGWQNTATGEKIISRDEKNLKPVSFCGIHVVNPEMTTMISEEGVFSIIEVYLRLARTEPIYVWPCLEEPWIDVGTPENLRKANEHSADYI